MSDDISIPAPTYRVPRHRGMDPGTRRLALIAAGIGGALLVIMAGWSMLGGGPRVVPVIAPQAGPVRVKPAHPGGLQVQGIGNDIFSGNSGGTVDKLAPPPEVPDPQALRAPTPPAPARVATRAAPATLPAPRPRAAVGQAAASAASPSAPSANTSRAPAVTASRAVATPISQAAAQIPARQPAAQPAVQQASGGSNQVQLAALSSESAAKLEWHYLTRRIPGLMAGRQPMFSTRTIGGHVFWQVRTGGFASRADAAKFCQQVRAQGQACYLPPA